MKLEDKCFAGQEGRCSVTESKTCVGCRFFKTKAQLSEEIYKIHLKLVSKYNTFNYNEIYRMRHGEE